MSIPEVEVRTFKQQGGESLKDAWYIIVSAHHRCIKKHSTTILLRNFYVGISCWNRHVLDTLTGGNFLGTPAGEAYNIIESLVGVAPVNIVKTETTLDEVSKKLNSLEESLPNILETTSKINESIGDIKKRVTILETSNVHDDQLLRIGELEESMEILSSTFSSLKFKKEKSFVEKGHKFMYVSKVSAPKSRALKIDKTFSATKSNIHVESSSVVPKVSLVSSNVVDLDTSLDNT